MPRIGVIRFPGSNCDDDVVHVARAVLGARCEVVWHKDRSVDGFDLLVVPGGFSYGDYLRCGAMARFSPVMDAVTAFAERGGAVVGICNGFQILCEAGLLEGALLRNESLRFVAREVAIRVERDGACFTEGAAGRVLRMPIAHGEGRYHHDDPDRLEREGKVVFRYVGENPNGSLRDIAGVTNARGNVVGLMPHPERASEPVLGSADGHSLFEAAVAWLGARR
ncbi:MAG: phosphoribosylformylglycinamidine synthase subunit PurQ [Myxococcota bacterium]